MPARGLAGGGREGAGQAHGALQLCKRDELRMREMRWYIASMQESCSAPGRPRRWRAQ